MYDAINIYYKNHLAEIGGIETMTYNLAYKYAKSKDILFLIGDGDPKQIKRLSKIAKVEKYNPSKQYFCKKVFITYETYVPENIHAEHRARVSHGDLIEIQSHGWDLPKDETITEDYGVSKNTCETVKKVMGKNAIYCPNPFIKEEIKPLLKLISPQRMTWEKGKERIKKIASELDKKEIPYQWLVFCNYEKEVQDMDNPNIIWVKSRLDIKSYIKDADYLVLVSDNEGSPMAPQEALMCGTPVIVTDLPCYKDLSIDSSNGFILKKDLSNLDVNEIYNKKDTFKFNWNPPKDIWGDILLDGKVEKEYQEYMLIKVKATSLSQDTGLSISELGRIAKPDEVFEIEESRLNKLLNNQYGAFVEVIPQEVVIEETTDVAKPKKATKKTK